MTDYDGEDRHCNRCRHSTSTEMGRTSGSQCRIFSQAVRSDNLNGYLQTTMILSVDNKLLGDFAEIHGQLDESDM